MQQRIAQDSITKSDRKEAEFGIEAEFEHLKLEPTKDTSIKAQQIIIHNLIPSTKLHILLDHLEEFLLTVNANRPDSQPLGLGYFAESVLESSHRSFEEVLGRFNGANKVLRAVVEFNAQSIGYIVENKDKDNLILNNVSKIIRIFMH